MTSLIGDVGAGEASRDGFRVPAPDTDVAAVDTKENRDLSRIWSRCACS